MCTLLAAVQGLSSVVGFMGQVSQTNQENAALATEHRDASLAAQRKYEAAQADTISQSRQAVEKGYDSAMAARQAIATGKASSSFTGISMDEILDAERQKAAQNGYRMTNYIDDTRAKYISDTKAYQAEAESRINSTPFKEGPNPLSLVIGLGTAAAGGNKDNPAFLKNIGLNIT